MKRAPALLLIFIAACASTRVELRGASTKRTLSEGRVHRGASVEVDRAFERDPSVRALRVSSGERVVLELRDEEATLYLSLDPVNIRAGAAITESELLSYAEVRVDDFRAVCKGGRGLLKLSSVSEEMIAGELQITVSCRTYLDGYEREEASLELSGPFRAET